MYCYCFSEQTTAFYAKDKIAMNGSGMKSIVYQGVKLEGVPGGTEVPVKARLWVDEMGFLYESAEKHFAVGKIVAPEQYERNRYIEFFGTADINDLVLSRKKAFKDLDQLYVERCGTCHRVYEPHMFDSVSWEQVMSSMKIHSGVNIEEFEKILYYLKMFSADQAK